MDSGLGSKRTTDLIFFLYLIFFRAVLGPFSETRPLYCELPSSVSQYSPPPSGGAGWLEGAGVGDFPSP